MRAAAGADTPPPSAWLAAVGSQGDATCLVVEPATATPTGMKAMLQALALAREAPPVPRLVIADHNMPAMSGLELAAQLSRPWPAEPIALSSGHVGETLQAEAARHGVRALPRKEDTFEERPALESCLLAGAVAHDQRPVGRRPRSPGSSRRPCGRKVTEASRAVRPPHLA